jgi:preprotein translocase subunit YajC
MTLPPTALPLLAAEPAAGGPGPLGGLLPWLLILGVFWLVVLRPMSKEEKQRKTRLSDLKKGDRIVLNSGICGRISNLDDPQFAIIEVADKVKIKVLKKEISDREDDAIAAFQNDPKNSKAKKSDDDSDEKSSKKKAS